MMKTRTTVMFVAALGVTAAACKKKEPDQGAQGTGSSAMKPNEPPPKPPEPEKPAPKTGQELAAAYIECVNHINAGKWEDFRKTCIADDYKAHAMDGPDIEGPDKLIEQFKGMRTGFPDTKLSPQLVIVSGRNILGVIHMTGTNTADSKDHTGKDVKATNKKVGLLMLHRLAINDENKATEEWVYMDTRTMLGQLGVLPKQAGKTRPVLDKGWDGAPIVLVTADDAKEKANLELVKKMNDAFNAHKAADMTAVLADDAIESDQAGDVDHKGKKQIEKATQGFLTAFPDIKIETPNVYAAGDYVVVLGTMAGTNKGPLGPGMKATNKPVTGHYAELIKVKDGKVAEVWRFRDSIAMAQQLGLMPEPAKTDAAKPDATKPDATKPDATKPDATKPDATKPDGKDAKGQP